MHIFPLLLSTDNNLQHETDRFIAWQLFAFSCHTNTHINATAISITYTFYTYTSLTCPVGKLGAKNYYFHLLYFFYFKMTPRIPSWCLFRLKVAVVVFVSWESCNIHAFFCIYGWKKYFLVSSALRHKTHRHLAVCPKLSVRYVVVTEWMSFFAVDDAVFVAVASCEK